MKNVNIKAQLYFFLSASTFNAKVSLYVVRAGILRCRQSSVTVWTGTQSYTKHLGIFSLTTELSYCYRQMYLARTPCRSVHPGDDASNSMLM